jgi:hypothetical protein
MAGLVLVVDELVIRQLGVDDVTLRVNFGSPA